MYHIFRLRVKWFCSTGAGITVQEGAAADRTDLTITEKSTQRNVAQFVAEHFGIVVRPVAVIKNDYGYRPTTNIDAGMKLVVEWYRNYYKLGGEPPRA